MPASVFSKAELVSKLRNEKKRSSWTLKCPLQLEVYQSSTKTLKHVKERSKDEPHWMSLAVRKLCGSWFIKLSFDFHLMKKVMQPSFCQNICLIPVVHHACCVERHKLSSWLTNTSHPDFHASTSRWWFKCYIGVDVLPIRVLEKSLI